MARYLQQANTDEVARNGALSIWVLRPEIRRKSPVAFLYEPDFFPQIDFRAAEDAGDFAVVQAGGVVFHAHRLVFFVEFDLAHAIHLKGAVQRKHLLLSRRLAVVKNHIEQCHFLNSSRMTRGSSISLLI